MSVETDIAARPGSGDALREVRDAVLRVLIPVLLALAIGGVILLMLDRMPLYHDVGRHHGIDVPLYKRAQITARTRSRRPVGSSTAPVPGNGSGPTWRAEASHSMRTSDPLVSTRPNVTCSRSSSGVPRWPTSR